MLQLPEDLQTNQFVVSQLEVWSMDSQSTSRVQKKTGN